MNIFVFNYHHKSIGKTIRLIKCYCYFSAPRLIVGAVYKHLGEMMKLLWGPGLHMNTVHVIDVARAIWHVANRDDTIGQTYNLVDEGDSTQGSISAMVSELFNINHDYWGTALSTLAKVK